MTTLLEHLDSGTVSKEIQDLKLTPPEDDPNYIFSEERIKQNNTAQNAVKYGWYSGVKDFFYYLQAIPGALDEVHDIILSKAGLAQPTESTVLESIEDYFKKVSAYYDPVRRGFTPPQGKKNKILAYEDMFLINSYSGKEFVDIHYFCEKCAIEYIKKMAVTVKVV